MVPISVFGIQLASDAATPVVLLRESAAPHRIVPVMVGGNEALAIAYGLRGVETPRPLTHDLLVNVLAETNTTVDHVVISEVRDGAFVAELELRSPHGGRVIDSRPSDAIAIAVRLGAPLFIDEAVLDQAGLVPSSDDESLEGTVDDDQAELVSEFRSFLDEIDPSDFA